MDIGAWPTTVHGDKLVQPLWRTVRRFLKKLEIELPYVSNLDVHQQMNG